MAFTQKKIFEFNETYIQVNKYSTAAVMNLITYSLQHEI